MADEGELLARFRLMASEAGHRLFRNNVGRAWTGDVKERTETTITLRYPRVFHGGLCVGSSDLIGWSVVEITPDMVGQKVAVFTAAEVKTPGVEVTKEQLAFVRTVNRMGGRAKVVYNDDDLRALWLGGQGSNLRRPG